MAGGNGGGGDGSKSAAACEASAVAIAISVPATAANGPCSTVAHSLPSVHVHLGEDDVRERVRVRALALFREGDAHRR